MRRYAPLAYLLAAVLTLWAWQRDATALGAAIERGRVADSLLTIAEARADSLKVVYRTDTLRLWREVRRTETLTTTVDQWKHDTVRVVEYVQQASQAINACTLALGTCEQRLSAQEAISAQWRSKFEAERARRPSFIGQASKLVIAGGIGWLAGKAGVP